MLIFIFKHKNPENYSFSPLNSINLSQSWQWINLDVWFSFWASSLPLDKHKILFEIQTRCKQISSYLLWDLSLNTNLQKSIASILLFKLLCYNVVSGPIRMCNLHSENQNWLWKIRRGHLHYKHGKKNHHLCDELYPSTPPEENSFYPIRHISLLQIWQSIILNV